MDITTTINMQETKSKNESKAFILIYFSLQQNVQTYRKILVLDISGNPSHLVDRKAPNIRKRLPPKVHGKMPPKRCCHWNSLFLSYLLHQLTLDTLKRNTLRIGRPPPLCQKIMRANLSLFDPLSATSGHFYVSDIMCICGTLSIPSNQLYPQQNHIIFGVKDISP